MSDPRRSHTNQSGKDQPALQIGEEAVGLNHPLTRVEREMLCFVGPGEIVASFDRQQRQRPPGDLEG